MGRDLRDPVEAYIKSIDHDTDELKNAQRTGSDSFVIHDKYSGNSYDVSFSIPDFGLQIVQLRFESDNQAYPFTQIGIKLWIDDPTLDSNLLGPEWYRIFYNRSIGTPNLIVNNIQVDNFSGGTATFYLKIYYRATDTGLLGVALI